MRGTGVIEPKNGPIEFGIDRFGGDYRHFEIPTDADREELSARLRGDETCRAWTYVRPGYLGQSAVCYLKNNITRPVRKACCLAGVVR